MNRCTNSHHFWQITNLNKVEDTRVVNRHQNFLISIQIVRPMSTITLSSISNPSSNRSNKCIFQICWMRISNRNRSKCSYSSQPLPQIWYLWAQLSTSKEKPRQTKVAKARNQTAWSRAGSIQILQFNPRLNVSLSKLWSHQLGTTKGCIWLEHGPVTKP